MWSGELLARVVDLDLLVDVIQNGFHLVLQAVQLTSFYLQLPLVLCIVFLQLCEKENLRDGDDDANWRFSWVIPLDLLVLFLILKKWLF